MDKRIARSRAAVITAAIGELATHGFARASVDRIAETSGVAKTTMYRHWPDRKALLLETARASLPAAPEPATSEDVRADLVTALAACGRRLRTGPFAAIAASLLDEAGRDPEAAAVWAELLGRLTGPVRAVLDGAGLPHDRAALDRLVGPVLHRALARRGRVDTGLVEGTVDAFLGTS